MTKLGFGGKNILDIIKYRFVFLSISALFFIPSMFFMGYLMITQPNHAPVKLGIDFTGGTFLQYGFEETLTTKDINRLRTVFSKINQENAVIQIQEPSEILGKLTEKEINNTESEAKTTKTSSEEAKSQLEETTKPSEETNEKTSETDNTLTKAEDSTVATEKGEASTQSIDKKKIHTVVSIRTKFLQDKEIKLVNSLLRQEFGNFSIIQVSAIGPSLGKELLHNAMVALLLVFGGIVVYLSFRFQVDYAIFALVALFHDAIFVIGLFALFGILFNTEVDSMFVTAVLTVIGFSVHDTIVVFDRVRENSRFLSKKKSFNEICNDSVNQTLARSINTSLTTIIVLSCLYFFGGVTTKDFVLAMLLGIAVGTYSSIFNASVLLVYWRELNSSQKKKRKVAV